MTDWDDYRIVLAISRAGSITSAAQRLGVNHSTVSRRLSQLEQRLEARLFDRFPDGYTVTEAGDAVVQAAMIAESTLSDAKERVVSNDTKLSGALTFSAPAYLLNAVILPKMPEFQRKYPNITIRFDGQDDVVSLHKYDADIVLRVTKYPPDGLMGAKLVHKAVALYAAPRYVNDMRNDQPLWIGSLVAGKRPNWVDAYYFSARQACDISAPSAIHTAAQSGLGIAQLPCRIGDTDPKLVRVPPLESRQNSELWLLYRRDLHRTARLVAFRTFLTDIITGQSALFDGSAYSA